MAQSTEKIESASAALGGSNDKEEGKAKVSNLLQQLDQDKSDGNDEDMDADEKDIKDDMHDEGLLGTEIAEEIEKSLGANELAILKEVKKLQVQHFFINKNYEDELQKIKFKYEKLYKPLYSKRKELLVNGMQNIELVNPDTVKKQSGTPYIPSYWLSCLKRHRSLDELIEDQDEAILEYLVDIRCEYIYKEKKSGEYIAIEGIPNEEPSVDDKSPPIDLSKIDRSSISPLLNNDETLRSSSSSSSASAFESFRLIFEFIDNPYFSPNVLTKAYYLASSHSEDDEKKEDGDEKKEDSDEKKQEGDEKKQEGDNEAKDKKSDDKKENDDGPKSLLKDALPLGKLLDDDIDNAKMNKNLLLLSEGNTAELEKTVSTIIQWKDGKDPTKKIIVKKQRNRRTKQTRTVQETVINDSFFNFFSNHVLPQQKDLDNMSQRQAAELQMVVEADYDIGVLIRDRIIPESVTWFLGLAIESEEEMEDEEDDGDEDDDYEDDSDLDSDEDTRGKGSSKNKRH